jgi:tetratricopeptide (TPR) repeat protein
LELDEVDRRALEQTTRATVIGGNPRPVPAVARVTPAQLPADVSAFTGRDAELAELDRLLHTAGRSDSSFDAGRTESTAVVISAVSGTAGVGKTALAVRWAHQARGQFPGGQLYVNLRGYDPDQPMTPADALARFLAALGVSAQDFPLDLDERAARYRTETAGRRMLILLDNASTVEQVRPLLPGTGSCGVVVTSRESLAGLIAVHGARRLDLDLLPAADAIMLLRRLIGPRVDAEPGAAAALARQCARLPLALRVVAELAVARPTTRLAELAAELADQQRRLNLLDAGGDPRGAVAAVFSWSIRHINPETARTFRLLGLHPGPDFDAYAAAALAGTGLDQARRTLDLLARAHLVHLTSPGRFGMHDLLRAYATSLATSPDPADDPRIAQGRLFDYYLATATAATRRLYPADRHHGPRAHPASTPIPALADCDTARQWLNAERACLVAVATHTAVHGWPAHTLRLSTVLFRYLVGGHYIDALAVHTHARDAARQTGDRAAEAQAILGLGAAHLRLGSHERAVAHLQRALALFRQAGDRVGIARALDNIGVIERRRGRYRPAADRHRQALALHRKAGDLSGETWALNMLGMVEERLGCYGLSADHHQQALALSRRHGDRSAEADGLNLLGVVEERLGRYAQAADHHRQALVLYRTAGDRSGEAWAMSLLGIIHTRLGRPGQAADNHRQAVDLCREIGDRDGEASALNGLGEATHAAGHHAAALIHHAAAYALTVDADAPDQQARSHTGMGHAHRSLGEFVQAREHYERAWAVYTKLGMPDADHVRAHLTTLEGSLLGDISRGSRETGTRGGSTRLA